MCVCIVNRVLVICVISALSLLAPREGRADGPPPLPEGRSRVSLHILDMADQQRIPDFHVYPDLGGTWGHTELTRRDVKDPAAFLEALARSEDPVSSYLRGHLQQETQQALANGDLQSPPTQKRVLDDLNAVTAADGLYDPERFAKVTLSAETKALLDRRAQAGDSEAAGDATRALNRGLLEDAYPALVARSGALGLQTATDPWCVVPPGEYWLVPVKYLKWTAHVIVKAGQSRDVECRAERSLFFRYRGMNNGPPVEFLLDLKSDAEMKCAIAAVSHTLRGGYAPMPRPNLSASEREEAVRVARRELPRLARLYRETPDSKENAALRRSARSGIMASVRILMVLGEAEDAKLIKQNGRPDGYAFPTLEIAYLENRLGILDQGLLAASLGSDDKPWAAESAAYLHMHGHKTGDARLRECLRDAESVPSCVSDALVDDADPATLVAMRAAWDRWSAACSHPGADRSIDPGRPDVQGMLYLLAYGDAADRRRVAGLTPCPWVAMSLFVIAADPRPLIDFLARVPEDVADVAPLLGRAKDSDALAAYVENAVWNAAELGPTDVCDVANQRALNTYRVAVSYDWPNATTARLFLLGKLPGLFGTHDGWTSDSPGNYDESPLDYLSNEEVAGIIPAQPDAFPGREAYLAAHRVLSRCYTMPYHPYRDGVERRPFILAQWAENCVIDGVLELRPRVTNKTLHVNLRPVLATYYTSGTLAGIGDPGAGGYPYDPYLANGAARLLGAVRLLRGGRRIDLRDPSRLSDGSWEYAIEMDSADLSDSWLQVDISFFDQTVPLTFDLFASDYALWRRGYEALVPAAKDRTEAAPKDARAWLAYARALRDAGRIDDAGSAFQQAIALNPGDKAAWGQALQSYADAFMGPQALQVARAAVLRMAGDVEVETWLAQHLFAEGDFAGAAIEYAKALTLGADDSAAVMRAASLYLAGDRVAAGTQARAACGGEWASRAIAIWYLSARTAGTPDADAATEALADAYEGATDPATKLSLGFLLGRSDWRSFYQGVMTPAQSCRNCCYLGYCYLLAKNTEQAKNNFSAALSTGMKGLIEYRMAQAELAQLNK